MILPGLMQENPADIMRGEETQIAGLYQVAANFEGVVCLPGTHTKWVRMSGRRIEIFQTAMTGEIFELISKNSVLRHSMTDTGFCMKAFDAAAQEAMRAPVSIGQSCFQLRANFLIHDAKSDQTRGALSGILLGSDIREARAIWLNRDIAIIGDNTLSRLYADLLSNTGANVQVFDTEEMTLRGLRAAYSQIKENI
jgi:2-dehydro-3-deoxygalactonokinase